MEGGGVEEVLELGGGAGADDGGGDVGVLDVLGEGVVGEAEAVGLCFLGELGDAGLFLWGEAVGREEG